MLAFLQTLVNQLTAVSIYFDAPCGGYIHHVQIHPLLRRTERSVLGVPRTGRLAKGRPSAYRLERIRNKTKRSVRTTLCHVRLLPADDMHLEMSRQPFYIYIIIRILVLRILMYSCSRSPAASDDCVLLTLQRELSSRVQCRVHNRLLYQGGAAGETSQESSCSPRTEM